MSEPETAEGDPAELALNKDDLTFMNAGEQYTLSVTGAPDGAKITYGTSSDESIVTVSENGVLTAKGKRYGDGKSRRRRQSRADLYRPLQF